MRYIITIDTEPDCDIHWRRSDPLSFTSVTIGIPRMLRPIWDRFDVKPLYFVSPEVVGDDDSCAILREEIRRGAIIGTHLHSEYVEPAQTIADPAGKVSDEFPCYAHGRDVELAKIRNFTNLIRERLGVSPQWYRAARYGADLETMEILAELGYRYDSSVTPGIDWSAAGGPNHAKAPLQPYWIGRNDLYSPVDELDSIGVQEYPITIDGKRGGMLGRLLPDTWLFYRWLRPTHMTVYEQRAIIDDLARRYADPVYVLMFHSMEVMINRSPFVRNRWMQRRFLSNLTAVVEYLHSCR